MTAADDLVERCNSGKMTTPTCTKCSELWHDEKHRCQDELVERLRELVAELEAENARVLALHKSAMADADARLSSAEADAISWERQNDARVSDVLTQFDRAERAEQENARLTKDAETRDRFMWAARRARTDAERFVWWFSDTEKSGAYINEYLRGVREHWTLDQWRASIDAARKKPTQPFIRGGMPDGEGRE